MREAYRRRHADVRAALDRADRNPGRMLTLAFIYRGKGDERWPAIRRDMRGAVDRLVAALPNAALPNAANTLKSTTD